MSGKPAARQGDMTQYGGSIVQGSAGVRIGAPTGVACSVCPGGVTSGHPVNPLLGAKVLPGETDIALPGPLPFILSRTYSSYRTKTPAPVGSLGPGWKMPADIRLQLRDNTLILSDNGGRSLYFEHLFPGEDGYSRSESLWLVRGGVAKLDEGHRLAALWQALPEELRLSPHRYLATNSPQGPWWLLGWCERVPEADEVLPAPLPPYRVLTGLVDRFGRTQTFHREAAGEFSGEITGVTDGAGRHFRLVLTTIQNDRSRIQTIYQPGSFTPLIRVETATGELAKTQRRSLADALQQSGGEDGGSVVFPPVLVQMLDRLESEILADRVSEESRRWLASCGLTVEQMQNQMDPVYTPARKIHLYHCDHRGLPLALISAEGATEWCAEYDEWGNLLNEENPHQLQQLIRLPGQQYDEESGLYYNRHRYYDPLQGRYITQDPIGLKGGWNFYQYPLNPVINVDPQGLVDINLYPESDLIHSVADEINIPGVFTIGGHGTPTSIESATRSIMTAKDLAYLIKFDGNYKDGMTVWLFSCNTGKGQNSFASQLAKELHTNVIGPDTLWTWWGRGTNGKLKMDTVLTAPTNLNSNKDLMAITTKDLGNWITYGPSGHPISNMQGTPEKPSDIR
ncbi:protein rhsC [Escherichia coli TW06591]|uniref:Truncated RhsA n=6 Tax=Escherichia coli TaxID=562 RepID=C5IBH6_ECOLX|nr:RHS repeat-associated core domain-containing protein [Escherichia coli]ACS32229.1 truncated RhsA [Escherichia coli]EIO47476.1 protein rhsC [Escherichia coli TW06591]MCM5455735.1 RHS repeat protein [Escherichia coli]QKB62372.1 RHS repeat protein [Escherichia coli O157:H7]QRM84678.1 RHS repeat family protein [Escherichia coli O157:H-]